MDKIVYLAEVRDSKMKKQSIQAIISLAQKIQNREVNSNDIHHVINEIIANNALTRAGIISVLESNDAIFTTDVRFFIIDLYDHIVSMQQRQFYIAQVLREDNERN
jgi:hypothetical protein